MGKAVWVLVLALLANGCKKEVSRPNRSALDSPVLISLQEELPSHALVLDCRTEREYPCFNDQIDAALSRSAAGFKVDFRDVIVPEICLAALGPARVRLRLGILGTGGVAVQFRTPLGTSTTWLEVTGDRFVLVANPNNAVKVESAQLRRIPDGTIWGFFGYARADLEPVVLGIRNEIQAIGAMPRALPEGRYRVALRDHQEDTFHADASGNIVYEGAGYYFTHPFAFEFRGDANALKEIVERTGREHGDAINLRIYTWQGDHWFSWVRAGI